MFTKDTHCIDSFSRCFKLYSAKTFGLVIRVQIDVRTDDITCSNNAQFRWLKIVTLFFLKTKHKPNQRGRGGGGGGTEQCLADKIVSHMQIMY